MFDALHQLTAQLVQLNAAEKRLFESAFSLRQVPKGFTLVAAGQVAKEIYFINEGLLRLYYDKDGEHITGFIFREHLFASCYESFLQQSPSIQYLETLEDCQLLAINKARIDLLYQQLPKINVFTRRLAEQRFINAQRILSSFLLDSPEQRCQHFIEQHGDLFLRVPHHIIASYLGITPVSLSRIRRRLQDKAQGDTKIHKI
ncbi:Crp/Fnr family transcriptional regulator [Eisenibacter elegans]|jgi:CRP-like cAMP-binding protein|uniref:Crp/Fnr family transcriptional regulator n=1 Tax=Eisenibacter elegans TaxID=997 RepID=UPI000429553A|nr:Crp/Fnr family transcriptional regulator [Eisenibacter elegans]